MISDRNQLDIRTFLETVTDAIIVIDSTTSLITTWNRAACSLFGYEESEAIGQCPEDLIIPEAQRQAHKDGWERYRKGSPGPLFKGKAPIEVPALTKRGDKLVIELSLSPVGEPNEYEMCDVLAVIRDVTEAREAQARLRKSEKRFRTFFEDASIGIGMVSLKGEWLEVNDSLCQIIGYSRDELLTMDFQQITHPEDLYRDLESLGCLLTGEIPTYQLEKRYVHKDGSIVWVVLNASVIHADSGEALYLVSQVRDITPRKRAEGLAARILGKLTGETTAVHGDLPEHVDYGHSASPLPPMQPTSRPTPRHDAERINEESPLSPREVEVVNLIAEGFTNHQIARRLEVSSSTIKTHVGRIIEKLQVSNRAQAAIMAAELGLIN